MLNEFWIALCLVMIIEGILPFAAPKAWREAMRTAIEMDDRSLRLIGLISMLTGTGLLYIVN